MSENELFGNSEQLNDTISRAAVVDEIEGVDWYHINENGEMVHGANDAEHQAWYKADDIYAAIERVPSAQPVAKDTNVPVKDCISRQAALDALDRLEYTPGEWATNGLTMCKDVIKALPPAQPSATDTNVGDMISRQAAIDAITQYLGRIKRDFKQWEGTARIILDHVPSAQQWIPCGERLPKKDGRYQVTRYDYVTNTEFVDILWYEENIWWNRHSTGDYAVTAWMPLPEPWKGDTP